VVASQREVRPQHVTADVEERGAAGAADAADSQNRGVAKGDLIFCVQAEGGLFVVVLRVVRIRIKITDAAGEAGVGGAVERSQIQIFSALVLLLLFVAAEAQALFERVLVRTVDLPITTRTDEAFADAHHGVDDVELGSAVGVGEIVDLEKIAQTNVVRRDSSAAEDDGQGDVPLRAGLQDVVDFAISGVLTAGFVLGDHADRANCGADGDVDSKCANERAERCAGRDGTGSGTRGGDDDGEDDLRHVTD
jgi:hypothetical protein